LAPSAGDQRACANNVAMMDMRDRHCGQDWPATDFLRHAGNFNLQFVNLIHKNQRFYISVQSPLSVGPN